MISDEQLRSIEHPSGHCLTHAVAGSGKTRMLVGRVRYLLEQGIPHNRIRVLAFNRAAAGEFALRLKNTLPSGSIAPKVSTFHSLGLSLTRLFENAGLLPHRRMEGKDGVEKKLTREAALGALKEQGNDSYPMTPSASTLGAVAGPGSWAATSIASFPARPVTPCRGPSASDIGYRWLPTS